MQRFFVKKTYKKRVRRRPSAPVIEATRTMVPAPVDDDPVVVEEPVVTEEPTVDPVQDVEEDKAAKVGAKKANKKKKNSTKDE